MCCAFFPLFSDYVGVLIRRGNIYRTCQREICQSRSDKAILLLFQGKCGCSGHEIIGDPCGEAEADHKKGGQRYPLPKCRQSQHLNFGKEKGKEKEKESGSR